MFKKNFWTRCSLSSYLYGTVPGLVLFAYMNQRKKKGGGGTWMCTLSWGKPVRRAGTPWSCRPAWAGCSTRSGATSVIQYTDCWVFGTWGFFWKELPYVYRTCTIIPTQFFLKVVPGLCWHPRKSPHFASLSSIFLVFPRIYFSGLSLLGPLHTDGDHFSFLSVNVCFISWCLFV